MDEKMKEEFQSRREFFKKVSKKALPFVAAILLVDPVIANASKEKPMGCNSGCYGTCSGSCDSTCRGECYTTCYYSCSTTCKGKCDGTCRGTCMGSCNGY